MYWTNFWQPSVHARKNIFERTVIKVGRSHLNAAFGTFYVQIDHLFEAHRDFKLSKEFEIDGIFLRKQRFHHFPTFFKDSLCVEFWPIWTQRVPKEAQRCEVPTSISVFQEYFVVHKRWAVKDSSNTYVFAYVLKGLFFWCQL